MWQRRVMEVVGELFAADGVVTLIAPEQHMLLWRDAINAKSWHELVQWFADRPNVTRTVGVLQLIGGVWLCVRALRGLDQRT